jgi:hypothetical protein
VLGVLYGIGNLRIQDAGLKWSLALLVHVIILSSTYGARSYRDVEGLFTSGEWLPVKVHRLGVEIADAAGGGIVLTLAPIFPLEGGARIYEEFAAGPFAWRIAPFVPEGDRLEGGIVSETQLDALLRPKPPRGILVGYEGGLEQPFIRYAEENGYRALELTDGKTLWLPPP